MLDGLACLMVLHGLLKVTGVQRNPGAGGLARHLGAFTVISYKKDPEG